LNALLPPDIRVVKSWLAPPGFHARYSARQKTYRYQVYEGEFPSVFYRRYALWAREPVNWQAVAACAELSVGGLDFAAFAAGGGSAHSTVSTMAGGTVEAAPPLSLSRFTADGVLDQMVRKRVGTLLGVGRRGVGVEGVREIMESRDRRLASGT